jgi:hypothetical protein
MNKKPYAAAPYRMRNEAGWMVCEDRYGRVIVLGLSETRAQILAELLNVALLAAPIVNYESGKPALPRPRRQAASQTKLGKSLPNS